LTEIFNAFVRMEYLGQHWFLGVEDARRKVDDRRREYDEVRPHGAIGDRAPIAMPTRLGAMLPAAQPPEIPT
jgi:putative transposase